LIAVTIKTTAVKEVKPVDCFLAIQPGKSQCSPAQADTKALTEKNRKYYRSSRGNVKSHPTGIQKGYDQSKI
jgi:hypothetical protein